MPEFFLFQNSKSSSTLSLKSISIEFVNTRRITDGARLAREKLDLIETKLEKFKTYGIKMARQEDISESSKHKRNESFNFSHKAARTTGFHIGS